MARPREFVVEDVVSKAAQAFGSRGYHALSIDDVLEATGLARQSFYNTFGNKLGLLKQCLAAYAQQQLATLRTMFADRDVIAGFTTVFESILAEPDPNRRRGCLMQNMVMELAPAHVDIADIGTAYQLAIEDVFAEQLARICGLREGFSVDDARRHARLCTAIFVGQRALAKAEPRSTAVIDAARLACAHLQALLPPIVEEAPAFAAEELTRPIALPAPSSPADYTD